MPSICYENFPRTIVEAFAKGTPVIASRRGAMAELVSDGRSGLLFAPNDASDLASKVRRLLADPSELAAMRKTARAEYEEKYTARVNYQRLIAIYARALGRASPAERGSCQDLPKGEGECVPTPPACESRHEVSCQRPS